jgi:hypothetical protein
MDPIQWLDLPPAGDPQVFVPTSMSRRDPRSYAAHVERLRDEEDLRKREFDFKVQQVMQAQQQQQQATAALPFITALDVNGDAYDQQVMQAVQRNPALLQDPRATALLGFQSKSRLAFKEADARRLMPQIAALDPTSADYRQRLADITAHNPDIYSQPATRDILREQSYAQHRATAAPRTNRLIEKALAEYPHLAQAYDDEVESLGEAQASRNLYWNSHDADLEKQLAEYGFDLPGAKPEDLSRLRLPDGKHYDPVRVTAWIKQNGNKRPDALTPEARDKSLQDLIKVRTDMSTAFPDVLPLLQEREQSIKARLGLPSEAASTPSAPTTSQTSREATQENWTQAKREVLGIIAHASGGDPTKLQELLTNPALRRATMGEVGNKKAVGGSTYGDVAEGLTSADLSYFQVPLQSPMTPGQMRGGPAVSSGMPAGVVRLK